MVVDEGVTVMLLPLPAGVPPQLPVYQRIEALLPSVPPLTRSVTLLPAQTESALEVIVVGALENVLTLTGLLTHAVLLQVPSIRTKYVSLAEGVTVRVLPVPMTVPLQLFLNHFQPALLPRLPPLAVNVTLVPAHTESAVAVIPVGAVEKVLTFTALLTQAVVLQVPSARTK